MLFSVFEFPFVSLYRFYFSAKISYPFLLSVFSFTSLDTVIPALSHPHQRIPEHLAPLGNGSINCLFLWLALGFSVLVLLNDFRTYPVYCECSVVPPESPDAFVSAGSWLGESPLQTHFLLPVAVHLTTLAVGCIQSALPHTVLGSALVLGRAYHEISDMKVLCLSFLGPWPFPMTVVVPDHHPLVFRPERQWVFCWGLASQSPQMIAV